MLYWNYILLLASGPLLVFANDSQPRFLAIILVLTATLGISLLEYDLWVIPGTWYIFSAVYFVLNLLVFALSPAQLLLLLWLKPESKPRTGIVVHHLKPGLDEEDIKVDIVAVHGLGSNPDWAWKHEETGVMWLKDLLPKDFPNARIMAFNHNSKWDIDASVKSVEACGQELLDTLNLHRKDEKRAIIFIGHSFGGIIIKKALVIAGQANIDRRYKLLRDSTTGVLFIGVPHNGSALTVVGKLLSYATYWLGSSTELLEALEPGTKLLEELNNSFLSAYNNHILINFYERWMTKKWGIPLLLAVDEKSGSFAGKTKIGLDADHVGANKFGSEEDNNYMLVRGEIKKMIYTIQGYSKDDLNECLKSLRFEGMGDREQGISENEKSTFDWIWNHEQFTDWQKNDSGVFWVLGKPGSGKSTFLKYVFRSLKKGRRLPRTAIAGFFFNDRGAELAKSPRGLLQALLYQIIFQIPELCVYIIPKYKEMEREARDEFEWRLETLLQALLDIFASPIAKSIYIFIDAADECKEGTRRDFYSYVESFCIACPDSRLKIFVTSRPEPWILPMKERIETLVKSFYTIRLQQLNHDDIKTYVKNKVKRFPEDSKEFLERELVSRADGVFLWVKLVIDDLEEKVVPGGTISEIRQRLDLIPTELNSLYRRMLSKISPEDYDTAKCMLQWVLLSKRPLTLGEFRYATAISRHKFSSHKDLEGSDSVEKPSGTEYRVQSRSGGLLEVVESRNGKIVQLIHQSAREFLMEQKTMINNPELQIIPAEGHAHLATICVSYLQFLEFNSSRSYWKPQATPFLGYAGRYWLEHAQIADHSEALDVDPIKRFFWVNSEAYQNWVSFYTRSKYWSESPRLDPTSIIHEKSMLQLIKIMIEERDETKPPQFGAEVLKAAAHYGSMSSMKLLTQNRVYFDPESEEYKAAFYSAISNNHYEVAKVLVSGGIDVNARDREHGNFLQTAVYHGHEKIVCFLVENGADVNAQGGKYGNALQAAASGGHEKIAQLLIENGADVNAQDSEYGDALQAATSGGHEKIAQLLIENGADVNAQGGEYGNALQIAASRDREKIAQLLIENGADVNAQGGEFGDALEAATRRGNEKIAQLLIENGADVNAQGGKYGNALQTAALMGHEEILQLLIENGADVNAQSGEYGNALQGAASRGHERIVQLLIENGADVNSQGGKYRNALQAAASGGHEGVVQLLIENGADANAQGGFYGNALEAAAWGGHEKILQLLIENGADVNAQGGEYGNALQIAASGDHEKILQLLIENGADVNAQGGEYGGALEAAASGGHEEIAQLLIENGADVNAQGGKYGNALQAAASGGHEKIVQLLIENGADVNSQGGEYGNALQIAVVEGHEKIVQLLIENGADANAQGGKYGNALQIAALEGHEGIAQLLIENGADVNAQGGKYGNALQAAASSRNDEINIIQFLIENGADVNAQGGEYGNALQIAALEGHEKIAQLLIENGADVNAQGAKYGNALQVTALEGHEKIVQLLIENGADVNAQGGKYGNALQAAALEGHERIVQLLIENGADANAQGGKYGNALQAAAYSRNDEISIIQFLIENGADVNAQGGFYGNALQAAALEGNGKIAQLLIENRADVNAQGGFYGNALQAAALEGNGKIVQLLIENRADVNTPNEKYGNALQIANSNGYHRIAQLLIKNGAKSSTPPTL